MKYFRKTLYILFALVAFVAVGLSIGSIDSTGYDDRGLLGQLKDLPDSQNGYTELAYTQTKDFILLSDRDCSHQLRQHVYSEAWDEVFIAQVISEGDQHMNSAISSLNYPYFKFPKSKDISVLPNYQTIIGIARMLIVKSMHDAKNNNIERAIQYAIYATDFSQKIKTQSGNELISHMIGLVMQYEALTWLNQLTNDYDMNSKQFKKLLAIVNRIPSYHHDLFPQIFSGEFLFTNNMIDMITNRPLKNRWSDYWKSQDWWNTDLDKDFSYGKQTTKEKLFNLMQALFPKFYIHKNRTLSKLAQHYELLSQETLAFCNEVNLPGEVNVDDVEWFDLITPNALADLWMNDSGVYKEYFTRRCFGHVHIEATKAAIAVSSYKFDHGELPESLHELIPNYLSSMPIDPFDGTNLKYSKEMGHVYSAGANFRDDGGSPDTYYVRRCEQDEGCANNPTFPILSALPAKEEYSADNQ
ncbi:MAG: hypothetical protein ABW139_07555 [Candidatus Thiodiazotropha sp. DIVDIV]